MVSADIQIVDCYIVPLQYGDLFIHVNSHNNPIKIEYYERPTNILRLTHNYENFSTMDVDDLINDFNEPLPYENYNNYDADVEDTTNSQ